MASIVSDRENSLFVTEDAELINGCLKNDRLAQHRLYNKYSKKMMALCYRYSKTWEEAEDTLNEGFMRVFEKMGTFKGTGSLEGWMRKVIVHLAIEKFRRNNNPDISMVSVDVAKYTPSTAKDEITSGINAKELIKLIQKLPPTYQLVFNLYVFEGLTHKEIAAQLGISEGTSKSNLFDAREWLKKSLETKKEDLNEERA